jgi:hypothetical protein
VFAAAEIDSAVLFSSVGNRSEVGAFVGTVAEGLGFALTAGTPVIGFACYDCNGGGGFLSDFWFVHSLIGEEF